MADVLISWRNYSGGRRKIILALAMGLAIPVIPTIGRQPVAAKIAGRVEEIT
jgi:hypothetical protein